MQQQILGGINGEAIGKTQTRVSALDVVRGLIMAFMALAHCQEYICPPKSQTHDWNEPSWWFPSSFFEFFQHAFISMMASGGFFMMMGIGIIFLWHAREKEGWSREKIRDYLIKRGSLLIVLQFTLLQLFEIIAAAKVYVYVGVLFALGSCMIITALFLYTFKYRYWKTIPTHYIALPLISIATLISGDLLIDYIRATKTEPSSWLISLFLGGTFSFSGIKVDIDFTPLPWFPAVAFGLLIGELLVAKREKAWRFIALLAPLCLSLWVILRLIEPLIGFGDYKLLTEPHMLGSASLLVMSKYPPSLSYFLYALGLNLLLLLAFRQWRIANPHTSKLLAPLQTFGRSPLCFFVAHWFIYFGISRMLPQKTEAIGSILLFWLLGLTILHAICKTYYRWKMSKHKESMWRMF